MAVEIKFRLTEKQYERFKRLLKQSDVEIWNTIRSQFPISKFVESELPSPPKQ